MKYGAEIVGIGLFAFLALLGAAFATDTLFQQHMWVLVTVLVISAAVLMRNTSFAPRATADAAGNALEGRSEPDEATVHSRAGSAATRDDLRTTEPAAKPQGDQP